MPRVKCPKHGVHLVEVPWARKGSAFTLLFEQAAPALVREMPVLAAARLMDITDTRLWRIVRYYVDQANRTRRAGPLCKLQRLVRRLRGSAAGGMAGDRRQCVAELLLERLHTAGCVGVLNVA